MTVHDVRHLNLCAYGLLHAARDDVPQVVWYCASVDCYGRTPLPEWNQKHVNRRTLEIVKVVKP